MTCAPDWPKTLRRASYRGALFWVSTDVIDYGRRIKTHQFPNRDRPFQEDLGEKAIDFKVTAYLASDTVLSEKAALVSACRQRGPATLVLPTEGGQLVVCFSCKRTASMDKMGYIAFELHFGEAGLGFGIASIAMLQNLVALAGVGAIEAVGLGFQRAFNTIGETSWVIQSAAQTVTSWLAIIDAVRLETPMRATGEDTGTTVLQAIQSIQDGMRDHVLAGAGLPQSGSHAFAIARPPVVSPLPSAMADLLGGLRLAAASEGDAVMAMQAIASHEVSIFAAPAPPGSPANPADVPLGISATRVRDNETAIGGLIRRIALIEWANAAASIDYGDRGAAVRARADISEVFLRELSTASGDVYRTLDEVRGRAVQAISSSIADLRPTIVVDGDASYPSLVWAHRLYGDAYRGDGLARRNRVRHPALMPAQFEAEAP